MDLGLVQDCLSGNEAITFLSHVFASAHELQTVTKRAFLELLGILKLSGHIDGFGFVWDCPLSEFLELSGYSGGFELVQESGIAILVKKDGIAFS